MNLNEGRAPQVTNTVLGQWIKTNYVTYLDAAIRKDTFPSPATDGDIIFYTVDNKYYQYDSNATPNWVCLGPNYSHSGILDLGILPTGGSVLEFWDTKSQSDTSHAFASLFLVYDKDPPAAPLLMTDQGFIVKKDLMVGGFIDSGQGALWLNYGLYGRPELSSPPCIQLMSSSANYPQGTSFPNPGEYGYEKGQLFNLTQAYYWNGHNYAADKYMWNGSDWVTGGFSGKYDTLFLFKSDAITPAHLDLGNLTTHGHITVSTPAIIMVGDGWGWPATGLLKYSDLDYFGIHTWGDAKPIHIGGSSVVFAAESGNPRLTIDGSGNVSLTGNLHSANSGSGGAYMDLWGNMILNGGSWGHSWNVYNEYGNCILNVPDQGGVHFYDGLGNVKAGITNGGNLSVIGSSSVGVVQYLGYGQGTRGPLYVYASENCYGGTICVNASSERFKQNIEALQDCSWLYNLRPVNFDWKDIERARVDGRQMGLIAEEVYAQNPQLVWLDESGQPEGVHYEWLGVPLLVELQKLRREVDDLKAKLAA